MRKELKRYATLTAMLLSFVALVACPLLSGTESNDDTQTAAILLWLNSQNGSSSCKALDNDCDGDLSNANGGSDCDDNDPAIAGILPESVAAGNCADGKDNDCSGATDGADPDC